MTNRELIEHLSKMPPEAIIIYSRYSESVGMDLADIFLYRSEDKKIIYRNGIYMACEPKWVKPGEEPEYLTVINFPGN